MKYKDLEQCKNNIHTDISLKEHTWDKIENYNVDNADFSWKNMSVIAACMVLVLSVVMVPLIIFTGKDRPPVQPSTSQSAEPSQTQATKTPAASETSTIETSPAKTTEPVPTQTTPPGYQILTESELNSIQELMRKNENSCFLTCIYSEPSEIDLNQVLYGCTHIMRNITDEDVPELKKLWGEQWTEDSLNYPHNKYTVKDINNLCLRRNCI